MNNDLETVFDAIELNASRNININDEDYINDEGLLVCGKCRTLKQCKVEVFGKIKTPMCLCKCEAEKREREENRLKAEKMRDEAFPEPRMKQWTFENDDGSNEKISTVARNYVDKFDEMYSRGKGLLFFGNVGTGKTYISACIANALIDKGKPCLVTDFANLVNTISGMYAGKNEFINSLNKYHLLVIDDLAAERDTEFMGEIVQNIINSRYRAGLPLIVTTNLTSKELQNPVDMRKQRIYSRLFEMCIPVEVKGKDRRREKLKADFNELNDLLGL